MNRNALSFTLYVALALYLGLTLCSCRNLPPSFTESESVQRETFDFSSADTAAISALNTVTNADYRLGIGDTLAISIYGEDNSLREVPVDPSGHISFLMTGSVPAAGRTIDELRADLQERISNELKRGLVQVIPIQFGSQAYTILGELNYPGTYQIEGRTTIIDAITRARGIRTGYFRNSTAEMADYRNAVLIRKGRVVPVDFDALIHHGDASQNAVLQDGDILNIPSSLVRNVYILGEVHFPRTVGYVSSLSLIQALTEARGLTSVSDGRIVVVRGSLSRPEARVVKFEEILAGKQPNLALAPGDIVYVPPRRMQFLQEVVETAITAFADTMSSASAAQMYEDTLGTGEDSQ